MAETFRIGLTGLNAATSDLSVTANNIANANTTGFKYSRAEFSDIFSNSALGQATRRTVGSGVQLAAVTQQFKQGNINATGNPLDIAIDGEGFFKIQAENGTISYTRAGTFGVDSDGYVVTSTGSKLQGFPADVDGNIVVGAAQSMLLQTADIQPRQTSDVEFGINLDAAANAIDSSITPFDPTDPKTYNYTTSATIYDSLGGSHTLSTYFVK
ncbi:MAG TPA: flagellar hook-basal body complex protein, partial [Plasticicumulans sp.]|nr:flagellar hook-basal body complex protein [Plasticicumulans sp.]